IEADWNLYYYVHDSSIILACVQVDDLIIVHFFCSPINFPGRMHHLSECGRSTD
ncbi:hypothetical protein SELMODRAFT_121729, partial [Selaginella moellendorffii]